jgi:hypothetical protein
MRSNVRRTFVLAGVVLHLFALAAVPVHAQLNNEQQGLSVIADFADRICKDIPLAGGSSNLTLSGDAKAELGKLVKRLGDLGFTGAAKYQSESYQNVLRADLVTALKDSTNCKLEIWKDLKGKLLSSSTAAFGALESAESVALAFLVAMDRDDCRTLESLMMPQALAVMSGAEYCAQMKEGRSHTGVGQGRTLESKRSVQNPTPQIGQGTAVSYYTKFLGWPNAVEVVLLVAKGDGTWGVAGYQGLLNGRR